MKRASPRSTTGLKAPRSPRKRTRIRLQFRWANSIAPEIWALYREAMRALRDAGLEFMLGGGFALAAYTGRWRDTKDIDFYIRPEDREVAVEALLKAGFEDYFPQRPYDRKWIFRSIRAGVIVDIIWAMANQRAQVDSTWFEWSGSVVVREESLQILSIEHLIWCKMYIIQHDHCDWPDVLNLVYAQGPRIDWPRLIELTEGDRAVLGGLLSVYSWLCPKGALRLPRSLRQELALPEARTLVNGPATRRARLLDTRAWFAAALKKGEKLEI